MNKHELKSLLENIYTALTEEGEWHPPLLAPVDPYPIPMAPPPPWLSPLSPTNPVATPPVETPVPTVPNEPIRPQPQPVDTPALIAEMNRIRAEIRRILRLPPENQEGLEALKAQLQALVAEILRRRQLQQQLQRDARKPFWS